MSKEPVKVVWASYYHLWMPSIGDFQGTSLKMGGDPGVNPKLAWRIKYPIWPGNALEPPRRSCGQRCLENPAATASQPPISAKKWVVNDNNSKIIIHIIIFKILFLSLFLSKSSSRNSKLIYVQLSNLILIFDKIYHIWGITKNLCLRS